MELGVRNRRRNRSARDLHLSFPVASRVSPIKPFLWTGGEPCISGGFPAPFLHSSLHARALRERWQCLSDSYPDVLCRQSWEVTSAPSLFLQVPSSSKILCLNSCHPWGLQLSPSLDINVLLQPLGVGWAWTVLDLWPNQEGCPCKEFLLSWSGLTSRRITFPQIP